MKHRSGLPALALLAALALAGCGQKDPPKTATVNGDHSNTSVLGGYGPTDRPAAPAPLTDAQGQPIPAPPVPAGTQAQAAHSGKDTAVAVWVQDGHVVASSWTRAGGWTPAQALEQIYGAASDPQLASNGNGRAMAVWRHTVGSIQALRYSRFDQQAGWTSPDVMPGALPRPDVGGPSGGGDAPRLAMDAQGNVVAQWQSGFDAREVQIARYVEGQGWTRAASEPVASARSASPAPPAPSSGR
jgi:hypothetical protein